MAAKTFQQTTQKRTCWDFPSKTNSQRAGLQALKDLGHNFCPARNHQTDVLWQYKKEYTKNVANTSKASRVVSQMFEFDNSINKIPDW
jgi:hypothetical protein